MSLPPAIIGRTPRVIVHHRLRLLAFPTRASAARMLVLADHEISRFPSKERAHMPVSKTTPGRLGARVIAPIRVAFRQRNDVGTQDEGTFAAQWLAYALPCQRFANTLTGICACLGVDAVRYSFIVMDLHHLLLAGLPAHSACPPVSEVSLRRGNLRNGPKARVYLRTDRGCSRKLPLDEDRCIVRRANATLSGSSCGHYPSASHSALSSAVSTRRTTTASGATSMVPSPAF